MKSTKLFFIALVLYFTCNTALAQTAEHKTYDYVTILTGNMYIKSIYVSYNGEKFEEIKTEKPLNDRDYNPVIKIVKKLEKEGYEVFSSNADFTTQSIYFLLRKEHKE